MTEAKKSKSKSSRHPKTVIGWTEYIDFPEWHVRGLKAKVDTGARTSALHVENLKILPGDRVRFDMILCRDDTERRVHVTAPVVKWANVRSSTGQFRRRCFIRTRVRIGPVEKDIEISLVSRERMIYRMLLGRRALEHDFVVDVSKRSVITNHSGPPRLAKKKKKDAS